MGRPEKPLSAENSALASFASDLRALRRRTGSLSYREMARIALFSPSVLSSAASGRRLPTLQVTLAFVEACGGDRVAWESRWRTLAGHGALLPGEGGPPSPPGRANQDVDGTDHRDGLRPASREAAVPPSSAALPRPAQLPPGPVRFIGRTAQLADARAVIAERGGELPLVISGAVGVGKTAFALHLTERLTDVMRDGHLYADLGAGPAGRTADTVLTGFLRALGVPGPRIPADVDERAGLYRSLLAERRVLVLLDDAQDEAQCRLLLAHASHSLVIITSRGRLLGLDPVHRIRVEPFERAESLAMLMALVGAARIGAEPQAAIRIAERCDDLPLALSMVGRRMAANPRWPVAHVADQLADPRRRLDRLRVGDLSVRDRLRSAYQRIPAGARVALDTLRAPGPGPIDGDAAPGRQISEELVEILVEAGLLQDMPTAGTYRMSPLVVLFAAEQVVSVPP